MQLLIIGSQICDSLFYRSTTTAGRERKFLDLTPVQEMQDLRPDPNVQVAGGLVPLRAPGAAAILGALVDEPLPQDLLLVWWHLQSRHSHPQRESSRQIPEAKQDHPSRDACDGNSRNIQNNVKHVRHIYFLPPYITHDTGNRVRFRRRK